MLMWKGVSCHRREPLGHQATEGPRKEPTLQDSAVAHCRLQNGASGPECTARGTGRCIPWSAPTLGQQRAQGSQDAGGLCPALALSRVPGPGETLAVLRGLHPLFRQGSKLFQAVFSGETSVPSLPCHAQASSSSLSSKP